MGPLRRVHGAIVVLIRGFAGGRSGPSVVLGPDSADYALRVSGELTEAIMLWAASSETPSERN